MRIKADGLATELFVHFLLTSLVSTDDVEEEEVDTGTAAN